MLICHFSYMAIVHRKPKKKKIYGVYAIQKACLTTSCKFFPKLDTVLPNKQVFFLLTAQIFREASINYFDFPGCPNC